MEVINGCAHTFGRIKWTQTHKHPILRAALEKASLQTVSGSFCGLLWFVSHENKVSAVHFTFLLYGQWTWGLLSIFSCSFVPAHVLRTKVYVFVLSLPNKQTYSIKHESLLFFISFFFSSTMKNPQFFIQSYNSIMHAETWTFIFFGGLEVRFPPLPYIHVIHLASGVSSVCSSFYPQAKNLPCRLTGISELSMWICVWFCPAIGWHPVQGNHCLVPTTILL